MNKPCITRRVRLSKILSSFVAIITAGVCLVFNGSKANAQPVITGISVFSCDSTGGAASIYQDWNTLPGDTAVDVFVANGTALNSPFINGPADAGAAVSIPLTTGSHSYGLWLGGFDSSVTIHGVNLFFNGSSTPGISVFAADQTSASQTPPPFQADGSPNTVALTISHVAGANSLSFLSGTTLVTLTSYVLAEPAVYNVDRISAPFGSVGQIGQDGVPDAFVPFTLSVTTVPEPCSLSILGLWLGLLAGPRFLRRSRNTDS